MLNSFIDMRPLPYQPCWGCGQPAGGRDANLYYGDFKFGIEHLNCGERIKNMLDRSLRALSTIANDRDPQVSEIALRVLITTSARKLENRPLDTIEEDWIIRRSIETEGMAAALEVFRGTSNLDDGEWAKRLEKHNQVMQESELIQELSENNKWAISNPIREEPLYTEMEYTGDSKTNLVLDQIDEQFKQFTKELESGQCTTPYFMLNDIIGSYCRSSSVSDLKKMLKAIENKGIGKVLFLVKESQDPTYSYITHISVDHVVLLPIETPVIKAKEFWQTTSDHKQDQKVCVNVLPLDCVEWKNHWVLIEEIGIRLSAGEGFKERS